MEANLGTNGEGLGDMGAGNIRIGAVRVRGQAGDFLLIAVYLPPPSAVRAAESVELLLQWAHDAHIILFYCFVPTSMILRACLQLSLERRRGCKLH